MKKRIVAILAWALFAAVPVGATVLWNATYGDINFPGLTPTTLSNYIIATVKSLQIDSGTKTVTASGGAATLNKMAGVVTTESLTTAHAAVYTLTLTNSDVALADQVLASAAPGTITTGVPVVVEASPFNGGVVITVQNVDPLSPLNGAIRISFVVLKN